jgi:hypothetical protein
MPFDAPRKTLDDIRRELDADYSSCVVSAATTGDVTVSPTRDLVDGTPSDRRGETVAGLARRSGYVLAALIGCLVGQLGLFGFFVIARPTVGVDAPGISTVAVSNPTSDAQAALDVTAASPPVPSFVPPVAIPPRVGARRPVARQPGSRPAAVLPVKPSEVERAADAHAGVTESEDEVRAALGQWLATSNVGDRTLVPGTAVFLRADGASARTYIPTKSGEDVVVREQHWRRGPDGWNIVEDREAWRSR